MKQDRIPICFMCAFLVFCSGNIAISLAEENAEAGALKVAYDAGRRRDPFMPLIGKNIQIKNVNFFKSIEEARIEGILLDPKEGSVVIVNGQVLKNGDFIGGFRVDKIEASSVVFSRDGETFEVDYGLDNT